MTRSGIILFDKPPGFTSHDLVAKTRRIVGTRKVGHAGTLDPMATGLMLLGVNSSTRLLTYLVGLDKEYLATIRLGATTVSDDAEGEIVDRASAESVAAVTDARIAAGVAALTGDIEQVPSTVSAIKIDGKRAYARARAGEDVVIPARPVMVSEFEVLAVRRGDDAVDAGFVDVDVRVTCSSGTYIRALARDLGDGLGVGGHLTALRRSKVGPFDVADAVTLDSIDPDADLLGPASVARTLFPVVELDETEAVDLGNGKKLAATDAGRGSLERGRVAAAIAPGERLVGLVERRGETLRTVVNFPADEVAS